EDAPDDGGGGLVDDVGGPGLVAVGVAKDRLSARHQLAGLGAGELTARRALRNALPLDLGREGLGGADEAADRRVLEALGHELQRDAVPLALFGEYVDVRLIAGE